jgi:hypothetical protein
MAVAQYSVATSPQFVAGRSEASASVAVVQLTEDVFGGWRATVDEDGHYCFAVAL